MEERQALPCRDGPMDGRSIAIRKPRGFILVWRVPDMGAVARRYQKHAHKDLFVADARPFPITQEGWRGYANGPNWDVVSYDAERMRPW